jgi:Tat-targeted selenate reductase subunit YnfE
VEKYGNEAVYINYSSGIVGGNITALPVCVYYCPPDGHLRRLPRPVRHLQYGANPYAMPYTYGSNEGNSTSDIENTKLVVMFGNNPAETRMSGGGITYFLEQARERSNA